MRKESGNGRHTHIQVGYGWVQQGHRAECRACNSRRPDTGHREIAWRRISPPTGTDPRGVRYSRHRQLNVQTPASDARSPFRWRMVSAFDPTDLGTSHGARAPPAPGPGCLRRLTSHFLILPEHGKPRLDVAAHVHVPVQDADDLHHVRAHPIEHHMRADGGLAVSGPDVSADRPDRVPSPSASQASRMSRV